MLLHEYEPSRFQFQAFSPEDVDDARLRELCVACEFLTSRARQNLTELVHKYKFTNVCRNR